MTVGDRGTLGLVPAAAAEGEGGVAVVDVAAEAEGHQDRRKLVGPAADQTRQRLRRSKGALAGQQVGRLGEALESIDADGAAAEQAIAEREIAGFRDRWIGGPAERLLRIVGGQRPLMMRRPQQPLEQGDGGLAVAGQPDALAPEMDAET